MLGTCAANPPPEPREISHTSPHLHPPPYHWLGSWRRGKEGEEERGGKGRGEGEGRERGGRGGEWERGREWRERGRVVILHYMIVHVYIHVINYIL